MCNLLTCVFKWSDMSVQISSSTLPTDIICLVGEALAYEGCDPVFTMLAKLTTKEIDLDSRFANTCRPVVLEFLVEQGNLLVRLPICPQSILGTILVDWGDTTYSQYCLDETDKHWRIDNFSLASKCYYGKPQHPHHLYKIPGTYYVRVFCKDAVSRLRSLTCCNCNIGYQTFTPDWTINLHRFCSIGNIGVTSLEQLFNREYDFNLPLAHVDVSACSSFKKLFYKCYKFNQPLNSWNVANVTDMCRLFDGAREFNQPLASWDVGKVRTMKHMFSYASSFNRPLQIWDVSSVVIMNSMFSNASSFNQPIGDWNICSVKDMENMFHHATDFNQPLEKWNVSSVEDMSGMFTGTKFNHPIGGWDVSSVTNMAFMFRETVLFNQPLAAWNVSKVRKMNHMFQEAQAFNQPLETWNVSQVETMMYMFAKAESFNQSLEKWNILPSKEMQNMFANAKSLKRLPTWFSKPVPSFNDGLFSILKRHKVD